MRTTPPVAAALAVLLVPAGARAAGLSIARFGGEQGTPMATNPTAIYYNPSGIADSTGGQVFGDLTVALRRGTYERAGAGTDAANAGRATLFNVIFEPFAGASYKFGRVAVGAALYIPFGGQEAWDKNGAYRGDAAAPGAVDGVQRWYIIEGEIRSAFLSAAVAYDLGKVSVGLSVNAIQTVVNTVQARNTFGDDDVTTEGRAWLDTSSWDFSLGAGVTYKPVDGLRLGLSYQSRPGFGGGIRAKGDLNTSFGGTTSKTDVAFTTDLPDVIRAGASYRVRDDIELRLFGDYQRWSVLDRQCVVTGDSECRLRSDGSAEPGNNVILAYPRDWKDTFGVRAGASYWVRPDVELMAGGGFSSKAIPSSTLEPALLDFDAITASLGVGFAPLPSLRLSTTYTQVFYLSRDTTGQSIQPTLEPPSRSPDAGGKYTLALGLVNVNAAFSF